MVPRPPAGAGLQRRLAVGAAHLCRLAIAAILLLAGCRQDGSRHSRIERVVSLLPSATEIVIAMGGADRLVARTDHDTHTAVEHLPSVGPGMTPNIERLALLDPDLVITWRAGLNPTEVAALRRLGLPSQEVRAESIRDVFEAIHAIGRSLRLEGRADSLADALRSGLDDVAGRVAGRPRPEVLYLVWADPPSTVGPGSYVAELIDIAGGRNAFRDAPSRWPQVDLETIVARDPEVLIVPVGGLSTIDLDRLIEAPGWRHLRAVREGRVFTVDADLFHRPGPRLARTARRLMEILHPEAVHASAAPAAP